MNDVTVELYEKAIKERDAEIAHLKTALKSVNEQVYKCNVCNGTGRDPVDDPDACRVCGGYGFNPGGDIREVILSIRALLKSK